MIYLSLVRVTISLNVWRPMNLTRKRQVTLSLVRVIVFTKPFALICPAPVNLHRPPEACLQTPFQSRHSLGVLKQTLSLSIQKQTRPLGIQEPTHSLGNLKQTPARRCPVLRQPLSKTCRLGGQQIPIYTSLCTGELNAIRKQKYFICSPFYGRLCRWAMLGESKP